MVLSDGQKKVSIYLKRRIIKNYDIICIEDLNTKGMLRNHKFAKSISDVFWSSFVTKLQYKADWYSCEVIKIDKWFLSSQICSKCGRKDGKNLSKFENGLVLFVIFITTEISMLVSIF